MSTILIIEDEKMLADMYKEKLEMEGFQVDLAFSSEQGIDYLKEKTPAIILLDILLPGDNGIEFLKKIKQVPNLENIPIIAFSNYDDPVTKKEAFSLGVKDYLIKANYVPNKVVERIRGFLALKNKKTR